MDDIRQKTSFWRRNGSFVMFLATMSLVGFLAQFQWIGYIIIAAYTILAFIKKLPAKTTFLLALLTLGVVPVAILLSNWLVAQNFAAYSFVLLVFGVAAVTMELRREPRAE